MTADAFGMGWSHNFVQAIFMHLSAMAHEEGVALDLYLDPRKAEDCDCLLEDFVRAAKARKFQAILSLSSDIRAVWMERLGLPMAAPGGNIKASIGHAESGLASSIAGIIASKGFRSAAVITTYRSDPGGVLFFKGLREQFAAKGIELREEWLRIPLGYFDLTCAAAFGYQQMNTLWQLKKRPEAVAVFPDILVPGVVCSALESGLGRSETPGFVFHKNKGNAPFCPFAATWIVADPGAFAAAMFRLVRQQIAGEEPSSVRLNFSIEPSA
jgi:DNA-binding LacI/PurR family transcriptional regulator